MSAVAAVAERTAMRDVAALDALYQEAARVGFTPGWLPRKKPILWAEPKPEFVPAHWRWQDAKAALDAAGRLIDVSLAERRNLVMRNPADGANFETTRTLVCAYQMILPGEQAPSHRHSSHALRVIIDGEGSFSTVDGVKMPMETGDVVLTPGWCWHGHGHDGSAPAYWFDGLDVPLTHLLEPMFYQEHPDRHAKVERVAAESPYRFTRAAIARGLDAAKPDPEGFHGPRIALAAPDMPPMALAMERGEVDAMGGMSWDAVKATRKHWLTQKKARVLYTFGLRRLKDLPGAPALIDLAIDDPSRSILSLLGGGADIGRSLAAEPGISTERENALRKAFMDTMSDPAFLTEMKKRKLETDPLDGRGVAKLIASVLATPPGLVARAKRYVVRSSK